MIDVSGYGDEPEVDFDIPAPDPVTQPLPPVVFAWREPTLFRRVNFRPGKPRRPWLLTTGAFLFAMVGTGLGVTLCVTILLAPIGLAIMGATCYPLKWLLDRHANKVMAWQNSQLLDEETVKPWE